VGAVPTSEYARRINDYYGGTNFEAAVLDAVRAAGGDPNRLTLDDLASLDQFHDGGREGTRALAQFADVRAGETVLDIGCGLGGPARTLAAECGCQVTGLDLSAEFCRAATLLTAKVGLADQVIFRHGSALNMPLADGSVDMVWMDNAGMNIPDKARLYAEIHRVLRSGGRYVLSEWFGGLEQPLHFPVPWAEDAATSFVRPAEEIRALLAATGFREQKWVDRTREWLAPRESGQRAVHPNIFMRERGPEARRIGETILRNVREGRLITIKALLERP
jgi:ubiquinone/menaquinone biosynthesis C-methylase UbiE